jgi:hypothetical protein
LAEQYWEPFVTLVWQNDEEANASRSNAIPKNLFKTALHEIVQQQYKTMEGMSIYFLFSSEFVIFLASLIVRILLPGGQPSDSRLTPISFPAIPLRENHRGPIDAGGNPAGSRRCTHLVPRRSHSPGWTAPSTPDLGSLVEDLWDECPCSVFLLTFLFLLGAEHVLNAE